MNDDDITIWDCPNCSSGKLIKRKNKKTGSFFLGCTNYPKCTYTQKMDSAETNGIPDAASVWEQIMGYGGRISAGVDEGDIFKKGGHFIGGWVIL